MINLFIAQNKPIKTLETVTIDFSGQLIDGYLSNIHCIATNNVDTTLTITLRVTVENKSGLSTYEQKTLTVASGTNTGVIRILVALEKITTFSVISINPTESSTQKYVIGEVVAP